MDLDWLIDLLIPDACFDDKYGSICENIALGVAASIIYAILAGLIVYTFRRIYLGLTEKRRVFISLPMAGLLDRGAFEAHRAFSADLTRELGRLDRVQVYCAYAQVPSYEQFENSGAASIDVIHRIRKCDYYIAILTDRVYSSVLIEIGYALARKKHVSVYFREIEQAGQKKSTLPYLLKSLNSNWRMKLNINKYKYETLADILSEARRDPEGFLNPSRILEVEARATK